MIYSYAALNGQKNIVNIISISEYPYSESAFEKILKC